MPVTKNFPQTPSQNDLLRSGLAVTFLSVVFWRRLFVRAIELNLQSTRRKFPFLLESTRAVTSALRWLLHASRVCSISLSVSSRAAVRPSFSSGTSVVHGNGGLVSSPPVHS
ncbi:unnamed protein product [Ixodes persulcatus]